MLVDSHSHLASRTFAGEQGELVARAENADVGRIVTIGTDLEDAALNLALARQFQGVHPTVGIHPTTLRDPDALPDDWLERLEDLARNPEVAALGEIGLDFFHPPGPGLTESEYHVRQRECFVAQLELAHRLGLNVVIHQRDSFAATLEVLEPWHGRLRCVFHCFTGSLMEAAPLIERGHLISFTGIVTFGNARVVQECAAAVPDGAFMVETDAPYLAPVPHRGKRCEPAFVRHTADHIARLRDATPEHIAETTTDAAERFFRLGAVRIPADA